MSRASAPGAAYSDTASVHAAPSAYEYADAPR